MITVEVSCYTSSGHKKHGKPREPLIKHSGSLLMHVSLSPLVSWLHPASGMTTHRHVVFTDGLAEKKRRICCSYWWACTHCVGGLSCTESTRNLNATWWGSPLKSTIKCIATIVWGGGRGSSRKTVSLPSRNASANTTAALDKILLKQSLLSAIKY